MFTLAVALMLASLRKLGVLMLLLGTLVGWARVYLGVHFPFDIVGSLLGLVDKRRGWYRWC